MANRRQEDTPPLTCPQESAHTLVSQLTPDGNLSTTVYPRYLPSIRLSNDQNLYAVQADRSIVRLRNDFSVADTVFRLMPPELVEEGDPSIGHFFFFEDGSSLVVIDGQFLIESE